MCTFNVCVGRLSFIWFKSEALNSLAANADNQSTAEGVPPAPSPFFSFCLEGLDIEDICLFN